MNNVIVSKTRTGKFLCLRENAQGPANIGYGASVLEAVGAFAIYSGLVSVKCNPPTLLHEFSIENPHKNLSFNKAPSRD